MGLLTVIRKLKQQEHQVRILILGLDNAGKTTLLKRLNGEDVEAIAPTFGFNIKTLEHRGYKLNFWDVGGQSSIRSYWRNYFEQTDGLIWVVDSADRPDRLQICRQELQALLQEERLAGATLLVYANKQDLKGALSLDQVAQLLGLHEIKTHHWHIEACSAYYGGGSNSHQKLLDGDEEGGQESNLNEEATVTNSMEEEEEESENVRKISLMKKKQQQQEKIGENDSSLVDGIDWLVEDIGSRLFSFE